MTILVHTKFIAYEFRMAGYANDEIGMLIICFDDEVGRAVLFQFFMNGGESCTSTFCQMQFLKKLAKTWIAIKSCMDSFACPKVIKFYAALSTSVTDDFNHVWHDVDLDRLIFIIAAVIVGIDQTFFKSLIRIVINHNGMFIVLRLVDILSHNHVF